MCADIKKGGFMANDEYGNRYREARNISNFILHLCEKYRLVNNIGGINVRIITEKHFADRCIDRNIPKVHLSSIISRLVRSHICEIIYLHETGVRKFNIYGDDSYMIGCSVQKTMNGNYSIKLHTIYQERKNKQNDNVVKIFTEKEIK